MFCFLVVKETKKMADDRMKGQLRACLQCKLIKSDSQFHTDGCENCENLAEEFGSIRMWTTPNFTGMISFMNFKESWVC